MLTLAALITTTAVATLPVNVEPRDGESPGSPAARDTPPASQAPADLPADASTAELLDEGARAFVDQRYEDALALFDRAAESDPRSPVALLMRGNAAFAAGRYDAAAHDLLNAVTMSRTAVQDIANFRDLWTDKALYAQRVDAIGRLLVADPARGGYRFAYGLYYLAAGYPEDADTIFSGFAGRGLPAQAARAASRYDYDGEPWVELGPPLVRGRPAYPPDRPGRMRGVRRGGARTLMDGTGLRRFFTFAFGVGGAVPAGALGDATQGGLSGNFQLGFFLMQELQLNMEIFGASFLVNQPYTFNDAPGAMPVTVERSQRTSVTAFGVSVEYHPLPMRFFDPSVRAGYAIADLAAETYDTGYYAYDVGIGVGHGPYFGLSLNLVLPFYAADMVLGLDTYYQQIFVNDAAGEGFNSGVTYIQFKFQFRF